MMVASGGHLCLVGKVNENLVVMQTTDNKEVKPLIEVLFQKEKSMQSNSPFLCGSQDGTVLFFFILVALVSKQIGQVYVS